jgi:disulfide bond formation protein DsbB
MVTEVGAAHKERMSSLVSDNLHYMGIGACPDNSDEFFATRDKFMSNSPSGSFVRPFIPALVLIGVFALLLVLLLPDPTPPVQTLAIQTETAVAMVPTATLIPPTATLVPPTAEPVVVAYAPAAVDEGRAVFSSTCSACHGLDARGIPGLGKNLIDSTFVHGLSDEALLQFIIVGRDPSDPANTTGIPMPARGGNPSLTDDQLRSVIAFLRTESGSAPVIEQGQAAPTSVPVEQVAPTTTPVPRLEATILPTTIPVTPQVFSAEAAYDWSCAGCHGADGSGSSPYAGSITDSALLADREALLNFLIGAHPPVDPAVEYPHPARGGYPVLTDEQLNSVIDYLTERADGE